jgi:hypothetical protein
MRAPNFAGHLDRTLTSLTIPQGYTLSVAGTFGVASHRYGSPFLAEAWGFVAGAVVAFVVLAALSGRVRRPSGPPPTARTVFNIVPVVSVLAGAGAAYAIPWPWVGFPAAGLIAVGGYVLLVSLFFSVVGGAG